MKKIYSITQQDAASFRIFVSPGTEHKETAAFIGQDGKPRMFTINFEKGEATVQDEVANYLLAKGLARESRLLLPSDFVPKMKQLGVPLGGGLVAMPPR